MTVAWMWGRSELRPRWRSWTILGILAVLRSASRPRVGPVPARTSVVLPRSIAAQTVADAAVLVNEPSYDTAKRARGRGAARGEGGIPIRGRDRGHRRAHVRRRRPNSVDARNGPPSVRDHPAGSYDRPVPIRRGRRRPERATQVRARHRQDDDARAARNARGSGPAAARTVGTRRRPELRAEAHRRRRRRSRPTAPRTGRRPWASSRSTAAASPGSPTNSSRCATATATSRNSVPTSSASSGTRSTSRTTNNSAAFRRSATSCASRSKASSSSPSRC